MSHPLCLGLSSTVATLTGETPAKAYSLEEFQARVEALLRRFGVYDKPTALDSEGERHAWVLRYALTMAEITYSRLLDPAPAPPADLLARFRQAVEPYPPPKEEYCQGAIDPASSLRRAEEIHGCLGGRGSVLFLGDDDATSVALSLLGDYSITAIDIDVHVIDWLRLASGKLHRDITAEAVDLLQLPPSYAGRFHAVVADPTADLELARQFLKVGVGCLDPQGWLFWADHPDWNLAYDSLVSLGQDAGLSLIRVRENWHSYRALVYNDSTARWFHLPPEWLQRLAVLIRLWSHLLVWRRSGS